MPARSRPLPTRRDLTQGQILRDYWIADHAALRALVSNFYKVDDDLYRSNHPHVRHLRRAHALGIRSVLSLRGDKRGVPQVIERSACADLGLEFRIVPMRSTVLPKPAALLDLLASLREMPKPMLVHCKSGADRTGLAVTLYLHVIRGVPLDRARQALHWRFAHLRWTRAGIVHRLLDAYDRDAKASGIGFEDWVRTRYVRDALEDGDTGGA